MITRVTQNTGFLTFHIEGDDPLVVGTIEFPAFMNDRQRSKGGIFEASVEVRGNVDLLDYERFLGVALGNVQYKYEKRDDLSIRIDVSAHSKLALQRSLDMLSTSLPRKLYLTLHKAVDKDKAKDSLAKEIRVCLNNSNNSKMILLSQMQTDETMVPLLETCTKCDKN